MARTDEKHRLLYASGALGFNVLHQTTTLWLVYFYAPPEGSGRATIVPLAVLGLMLGAGRLIEAIDDPIIGHWSDVTRGRWGRRLPFIVAGTPFLTVAFILLWLPPPLEMPWLAVYVFLIVQLYFLCSTIVHQPYEAILAELARRSADRVRVSSWKVVFGLIGAAGGLVGSGLLIGMLGFVGMAIALGLLAAVAILLSALGIRRLPQQSAHAHPLPLWDALRLTATNRQFLVFVCSEIAFYFGLYMLTQLVPYFVTVVLRLPEGQVAFFTGAFALTALASLPAVNWLTAERTKAFTYRLAMAVLVLLLPGLFFVGTIPGVDRTLQALLYIAVLGVPMSVLFVLPNPLIGDIVDDDERRTGLRREGVYYGVEETLNKFGFAMAAVTFSLVLDTFGFSTDQPLGLRMIGPVAGLGVLIGAIVFTVGYRLPDQIPPARERAPTCRAHDGAHAE